MWQSVFKCHAIQRQKRRIKRRARYVVTKKNDDPIESFRSRFGGRARVKKLVQVRKPPPRCRVVNEGEEGGREKMRVSGVTRRRGASRDEERGNEGRRHELPQRAKLKNGPGPGVNPWAPAEWPG